MVTKVEVDETLVGEAMALFGLESKEAAVEEALRRALREATQRRAVEELIGLGWEGDLDSMRQGRVFDASK